MKTYTYIYIYIYVYIYICIYVNVDINGIDEEGDGYIVSMDDCTTVELQTGNDNIQYALNGLYQDATDKIYYGHEDEYEHKRTDWLYLELQIDIDPDEYK